MQMRDQGREGETEKRRKTVRERVRRLTSVSLVPTDQNRANVLVGFLLDRNMDIQNVHQVI